jgi:uncharacterized protein
MVEQLGRFFGTPEWRRQHRWRRAIWQGMAHLGLTGIHALPMSRRWVDINRRTMPMERLDPCMEGFKIVQLSDLHYSPVVWQKYLEQFVHWVNELKPDLVAVTGDLITGGYRYATGIADILAQLQATHGVICTFGNHDYSIHGKRTNGEGKRRADFLEKALEGKGLIVLRNEALAIRPKQCRNPLVIVGLDDEWSGSIDPPRAWRSVDPSLPIVCLNHNPVNARELLEFPWQWMLAGHTHGRQVGTSRMGKRLYGHRFRHYVHGYYSVSGRHLYVNRGLSYGQRKHDWCRPEVTVFRLEHAAPGQVVERGSDSAACNE